MNPAPGYPQDFSKQSDPFNKQNTAASYTPPAYSVQQGQPPVVIMANNMTVDAARLQQSKKWVRICAILFMIAAVADLILSCLAIAQAVSYVGQYGNVTVDSGVIGTSVAFGVVKDLIMIATGIGGVLAGGPTGTRTHSTIFFVGVLATSAIYLLGWIVRLSATNEICVNLNRYRLPDSGPGVNCNSFELSAWMWAVTIISALACFGCYCFPCILVGARHQKLMRQNVEFV